jgi:hypothetical protein
MEVVSVSTIVFGKEITPAKNSMLTNLPGKVSGFVKKKEKTQRFQEKEALRFSIGKAG